MSRYFGIALVLSLLAVPAQAAEMSYVGDAVIRSIAANRIAVFIDGDGDQVIDKGFLLTTDIPTHGKYAVRLNPAKVTYTDGYVRVTFGKKVYDLSVAGYPDSPATPRDAEVVTLIGSALQHSRGNSGCDVKRAHEGDAGQCYAYGSE